jgi:hypothetical protein
MPHTHSQSAIQKFSAPKSTKPKSGLLLAFLCTSLTIGSAVGLALSSSLNLPAQSQSSLSADQARRMPNESVIQSVRLAVKQQFGVQNVNILSVSEQNWPDGCLGLPRGKEACTMAIVPGWRITVSDRMQSWTYRTDLTGNILRLENPDRAGLPQAVARKLLQQVARDTNLFRANLRITEVKAQDFDGCLGIYTGPTQKCPEILIPGWKAIVTSPTQTFVYHLSQDASRIVQNKTASGAKRSINVSFSPFGTISSVDANVVFESSSSGDLAGRMMRTVLTEDGKITLYQSSPTARYAPVLIKTLSPAQILAFKKVLETQRFPNLKDLSYLTSASLADYPTTTYQSRDTATQFIDLEKKSLPRSLQQTIVKWESLIK